MALPFGCYAALPEGRAVPTWLPVVLGTGGGVAVIGGVYALVVILKKHRN